MTHIPRNTFDPNLSMPSHDQTHKLQLLLASSNEVTSEPLAWQLSLLQTPTLPVRFRLLFSLQGTQSDVPSRKRRSCMLPACTRGQNLQPQSSKSSLGWWLAWSFLQLWQASLIAYSERSTLLDQFQLNLEAYSTCLWVILERTKFCARDLAGLGNCLNAGGQRGLRVRNSFVGCPSGGSRWPCYPHLGQRVPLLW